MLLWRQTNTHLHCVVGWWYKHSSPLLHTGQNLHLSITFCLFSGTDPSSSPPSSISKSMVSSARQRSSGQFVSPNTVEAVLGPDAPSSADSRPCSRCRTLTLDSLLRWTGASVTLVGGLTSSSSISPSAKFPSGLGTPSRVTMNLGLAESPRSLLTLENKHNSENETTKLETGQGGWG